MWKADFPDLDFKMSDTHHLDDGLSETLHFDLKPCHKNEMKQCFYREMWDCALDRSNLLRSSRSSPCYHLFERALIMQRIFMVLYRNVLQRSVFPIWEGDSLGHLKVFPCSLVGLFWVHPIGHWMHSKYDPKVKGTHVTIGEVPIVIKKNEYHRN